MKRAAIFTKIYWKEVLVLSIPVIVIVSTIVYNCLVHGIQTCLLTM